MGGDPSPHTPYGVTGGGPRRGPPEFVNWDDDGRFWSQAIRWLAGEEQA